MLKAKGLKIVVAFVHGSFSYEVWLSGGNRGVQSDYFEKLKDQPHPYVLTADPYRIDYILKKPIDGEFDYDNPPEVASDIKSSIEEFLSGIGSVISL